ncbi:SDR family NAD(P)-dependent oxidoreductase [Streptomyces sp. DH37]|uniref:SDR family NAD(P)-dependent oxidoreductase n=1 Tax=Streptomyces sp. DH37 TaxID=3040122 RepID=UPI002441BD9B|nr:SDR family oxidoreductase [Streptomyces sp. DH37]MDG9701579.1 SDR family oxidoreductase [Streptomyces sp. DH37]
MITGASSGIGAAAARVFAAQGAHVVLMARRAGLIKELADELVADGARALAVPGDVTSADDVRHVVAETVRHFGRLDAAFNNAGWGTAGLAVHEVPDAMYDQIMDVNVRGVWNCLRHQIPVMIDQGTGGSIVNTSSTAGRFATGAVAPYVAAKHAVLGLTKAAAADYGEQGIRVNALVVGGTRTPLMEQGADLLEAAGRHSGARAIQRRLAHPAEVANAAAWLCSDLASFVTGAEIAVDGGVGAV